MKPILILASSSPQRKTLLEALGLPFEVIPSTFDESSFVETDPEKRARNLSFKKADEVAQRFPNRFVIGCDTLVVTAHGTLLEKPKDEADARRMLKEQGNGISIVHSGVCVIGPDKIATFGMSTSLVYFRALSDADISWWMNTKQWEGRSGGFQIDGPGQFMIRKIEGDFTGIVGLPVYELGQCLTIAGYPLLD